MPCDTEIILSIPLCNAGLLDKFIWHYNNQGTFTVRSAYHMSINDRMSTSDSPSMADNGVWKSVWKCDVPPRIKFLSWRARRGVLPSTLNISKRVQGFAVNYSVCGHSEESDVHACLECPLAGRYGVTAPLMSSLARPDSAHFWDQHMRMAVCCERSSRGRAAGWVETGPRLCGIHGRRSTVMSLWTKKRLQRWLSTQKGIIFN
ncbi:hypothetical protein Cgig2_022940 [Carnegiea gigantea]|uniref:Reverse transcriptase zinc-binding domain-containing protein n=1 Tax=Carnegiea gigantea TaxID=171969 RepID=A0A9Q1KCP8_9CARY|nr:hypothetical protein Cgig2_022940 [Carnegiea gigantea]